jgi:hypothetical protein
MNLLGRNTDQIGGGAEVGVVDVEVVGTGSHELLQQSSHRVCYDTHFPCLKGAWKAMLVFWHNHLEETGMAMALA